MTLVLNQNWIDAFAKSTVEIRFLLIIDVSGSLTLKATDGICTDSSFDNIPQAVFRITSMAAELDVFTRQVQAGEIDVEVHDAWFRPIVVSNFLRGKKVTIKIGSADLAETDFETYFVGVISGIKPDGKERVITIQCQDAFEFLLSRKVRTFAVNKHPLEVIEDVLNRADLPSSLIDSASFDPSIAAHDKISHLILNRFTLSNEQLDPPVEAFSIVSEIVRLLNGILVIDEDGRLTFKLFNPSATIAVNWTQDDIGELRQISVDDNLVNQITYHFNSSNAALESDQIYEQGDTTSQADHAFLGETERIVNEVVRNDWAETFTVGNMLEIPVIIGADNIKIWAFGPLLMTGTREAGASGGQPADAKVSATRPLFIRIDDEIIKATTITFTASAALAVIDPDTGKRIIIQDLKERATLTGLSRGQLGTTEVFHSKNLTGFSTLPNAIMDITFGVFLSERLLERFTNGIEIIEVTTSIKEFNLQLGDLVTIVWPEYLAKGRNGLTSAFRWEIVGKELQPYEDPPVILWKLANANIIAAATKKHSSRDGTGGYASGAGTLFNNWLGTGDEKISTKFIAEGLELTASTGLQADLSSGYAMNTSQTVVVPEDTLINLEPDSDNYVSINPITGSVFVRSVSIGGAAPNTSESLDVPLGIVTTDATSVTSVDTTIKAQDKAIDGDRVVTETVAYGGALNVETDFSSYLANADFGSFSKG